MGVAYMKDKPTSDSFVYAYVEDAAGNLVKVSLDTLKDKLGTEKMLTSSVDGNGNVTMSVILKNDETGTTTTAEMKKLQIGDTIYDIADSTARKDINTIKAAGYVTSADLNTILAKYLSIDDNGSIVSFIESTETGIVVHMRDESTVEVPISQAKEFETVDFDNETRYLHFYDSDGNDVFDPVMIEGGGGGGSSSSSVVTLTNQNGVNAMTIPLGGTVILKFNFTSTESDLPTGDGSCQISVNGSTKTTFNIQQGLTTYDVSQYLISGSNTIRVTCTDVYGNYKTLIYRVSVVEIYVTSTFDATIPYSDDITFKYTAYGSAEKTVHILVDGNEIASSVSTVSGRMVTQIIPKMSHGVHVLDVFITAEIDGSEMESPHLKYEVMCVERSNTSPMIAAVYDTTELNEGQQVDIPYIVYDPSALSADITLDIYTMKGSSEEIFNAQSITVDRSQQHWITRKYPIGTVYFRIKYGEINKTFTIEVSESPIKVTPETTDLELQLTAEGRSNNESKPNVWKYNSIDTTFNNFNWHSNGWLTDQNGDTCLRFNGDTTATINFKPFESDIRTHGKTIELEFSARDVNRRDSVIISCLSGGIGFEVTPDGAYIKSEQSTVSCKFKDEKKVKLTFVVEARNLYRQLSLYLNGVLSDIVQYPDSDNFQQKNPVTISIGSPTCAVDIYSIRSYSNGFGSSVAVNNYIADIKDVIERTEAYERNDIYDEYQNVSFEKVKKYNSVMVLVGDLPQSKGDKKKLKVIYTDVDDPSISFTEDDVSADVQGTSSQYYVRKNWKLKFAKNHYIDKTQLPAKVICIKVDYAEATGTHNTQNAIVAETLYSERIPPQDQDPKCRTTIYGKPILLFHQADENSEPTFYAKANFNYDKGAEHVFGFTPDYDVECWEFCNNTSDACNFLAEVPDDWGDDFEARYPDEYSSIGRFKTMHSWVVSTRKDTATGASLSSTYVGKDGKEYTRDTAEYRLAKFKMEFEDHFNLHYCLIYYVYTFFALMVDQRAKNMFMTYWASKGKWYPYFYDNDTCFGINNEGQLVFDYYHEDTDKLDGANVYNGQNSVLWNNFREAFADEIKTMYQSLRNDKKLTYDKLVDRFVTNGSDKWSESIYNEDSDFKYITMLRTSGDGSNLSQVRGTGEEHLCYMLENRFNYCDSKWYASDYANDYISLRIYTPDAGTWSGVAPSPAITITPFSTMYAGIRYKANGSLLQQKVESGKSVTFGSDLTETFNDTETAIYGAHQISSIGDLAPLYCGSINVSKADKLIELKVGDGTEGYVNNNLINLSVGTNHQMRVIDVQNCPKLDIVLDVSNCSNIEEIYAKGSGITGVSFPDGGVVKKVELPATISNFTIKNQAYIDSVTFEGYDNIKTLWVENTPNVDGFDILSKATNVERLRLTDVNLQYDTIDDLVELSKRPIGGIDENGNNVDIMWISGKCHVKELTGAQYAIVNELFPYLTITYTALTTQLTFKSYDGSVTYTTQTIRNGGNGIDPVSSGAISTPTRESTAQYSFTFAGWSLVQNGNANSSALNKVEIDRTVYAAFTGVTRKYTVKFYNGTELLQTDTVEYGKSTSYRGETPQNTSTGNPSDFEFTGWSPSPTNITGYTECYAQYHDLRVITDDWGTIKAKADSLFKGVSYDYPVGLSKKMPFTKYHDFGDYITLLNSQNRLYIIDMLKTNLNYTYRIIAYDNVSNTYANKIEYPMDTLFSIGDHYLNKIEIVVSVAIDQYIYTIITWNAISTTGHYKEMHTVLKYNSLTNVIDDTFVGETSIYDNRDYTRKVNTPGYVYKGEIVYTANECLIFMNPTTYEFRKEKYDAMETYDTINIIHVNNDCILFVTRYGNQYVYYKYDGTDITQLSTTIYMADLYDYDCFSISDTEFIAVKFYRNSSSSSSQWLEYNYVPCRYISTCYYKYDGQTLSTITGDICSRINLTNDDGSDNSFIHMSSSYESRYKTTSCYDPSQKAIYSILTTNIYQPEEGVPIVFDKYLYKIDATSTTVIPECLCENTVNMKVVMYKNKEMNVEFNRTHYNYNTKSLECDSDCKFIPCTSDSIYEPLAYCNTTSKHIYLLEGYSYAGSSTLSNTNINYDTAIDVVDYSYVSDDTIKIYCISSSYVIHYYIHAIESKKIYAVLIDYPNYVITTSVPVIVDESNICLDLSDRSRVSNIFDNGERWISFSSSSVRKRILGIIADRTVYNMVFDEEVHIVETEYSSNYTLDSLLVLPSMLDCDILHVPDSSNVRIDVLTNSSDNHYQLSQSLYNSEVLPTSKNNISYIKIVYNTPHCIIIYNTSNYKYGIIYRKYNVDEKRFEYNIRRFDPYTNDLDYTMTMYIGMMLISPSLICKDSYYAQYTYNNQKLYITFYDNRIDVYTPNLLTSTLSNSSRSTFNDIVFLSKPTMCDGTYLYSVDYRSSAVRCMMLNYLPKYNSDRSAVELYYDDAGPVSSSYYNMGKSILLNNCIYMYLYNSNNNDDAVFLKINNVNSLDHTFEVLCTSTDTLNDENPLMNLNFKNAIYLTAYNDKVHIFNIFSDTVLKHIEYNPTDGSSRVVNDSIDQNVISFVNLGLQYACTCGDNVFMLHSNATTYNYDKWMIVKISLSRNELNVTDILPDYYVTSPLTSTYGIYNNNGNLYILPRNGRAGSRIADMYIFRLNKEGYITGNVDLLSVSERIGVITILNNNSIMLSINGSSGCIVPDSDFKRVYNSNLSFSSAYTYSNHTFVTSAAMPVYYTDDDHNSIHTLSSHNHVYSISSSDKCTDMIFMAYDIPKVSLDIYKNIHDYLPNCMGYSLSNSMRYSYTNYTDGHQNGNVFIPYAYELSIPTTFNYVNDQEYYYLDYSPCQFTLMTDNASRTIESDSDNRCYLTSSRTKDGKIIVVNKETGAPEVIEDSEIENCDVVFAITL